MITGIRCTMTISSISELKLVLLKSSEANFLLPGIFDYRCTIHSADGMKGTIVVS